MLQLFRELQEETGGVIDRSADTFQSIKVLCLLTRPVHIIGIYTTVFLCIKKVSLWHSGSVLMALP